MREFAGLFSVNAIAKRIDIAKIVQNNDIWLYCLTKD